MELNALDRPSSAAGATVEDAALAALLAMLEAQDYRFVTPTPATHARVLARPGRDRARDLRDAFGWSRPFDDALLPPTLHELLLDAGVIVQDGAAYRATVRVSRVHGTLFLHSAYPTEDEDAVFLGPDSYRFADLVTGCMGALAPGARVLDFGAGSGVGGIVAAKGREVALTLADINRKALRLAEANATHAAIRAELVEAEAVADLPGRFDVIVMNPPYMMDAAGRAYRDGGDLHGARLSLDWALAGADKLAPGGRLILYTGVAIVEGRDVLREHLVDGLGDRFRLDYREIDPDVFGEELEKPAYRDVERIAAVGACITR